MAPAQGGRLVVAEVAQSVQPLEDQFRRQARLDGGFAAADAQDADGADAVETGEGQSARELNGQRGSARGPDDTVIDAEVSMSR